LVIAAFPAAEIIALKGDSCRLKTASATVESPVLPQLVRSMLRSSLSAGGERHEHVPGRDERREGDRRR